LLKIFQDIIGSWSINLTVQIMPWLSWSFSSSLHQGDTYDARKIKTQWDKRGARKALAIRHSFIAPASGRLIFR
jgi:hypothetical protein